MCVPVAAALQGGRWSPREGIELEGKTLALIGCGAIAQAVARIAAAGFGMRVVGYARTARASRRPHFAEMTTDFGEAVRGRRFRQPAHSRRAPRTRAFINRERLAHAASRAPG